MQSQNSSFQCTLSGSQDTFNCTLLNNIWGMWVRQKLFFIFTHLDLELSMNDLSLESIKVEKNVPSLSLFVLFDKYIRLNFRTWLLRRKGRESISSSWRDISIHIDRENNRNPKVQRHIQCIHIECQSSFQVGISGSQYQDYACAYSITAD